MVRSCLASVVVGSALATAVFACSGAGPNEETGTIAPLALSDGDGDGGLPESGTTACASSTTQPDCVTCCGAEEPLGARVYRETVRQCLCQVDVCQAECGGDLCTGHNPSVACNACVEAEGQAACAVEVSTSCSASQECARFGQCLAISRCASKPAM